MSRSRLRLAASAFGLLACRVELDAGFDEPHGPLPVDERNPIVVVNDGAMDNWQGEYAALLAGAGRARLFAIVVNKNAEYPSLEANVGHFRELVAAGRASGMTLPDPVASVAPSLVRPDSDRIEDTLPNRSEGARLIVRVAAEHATRARPLTIATGGALTDVADAYLLEPTLAERVVVVASLGKNDGNSARTNEPNGARDRWATFIVTSRLPYVQVNGYYDQMLDLPEERVADLPNNAFGEWMARKRTQLLDDVVACDQVSVLAAALPWFSDSVSRMRQDADDSTLLVADADGPLWHVGHCDTERARNEVWAMLGDPKTFR